MANHNTLEKIIIEFDCFLKTMSGQKQSKRLRPGATIPESPLSTKERNHVAALMRINHVGEVCAQALYQGQRLSCNDECFSEALAHAAEEEIDHLVWCHERLLELNSHRSLLLPIWYLSSLAIGYSVGKIGIHWNLAFLAETEQQVAQHLTTHLEQLPEQDIRTRMLLETMRIEELAHSQMAEDLGAKKMPTWAKKIMYISSRVMVSLTYWI